MAKLIDSVKALGEKITGEKINGDTLFDAVKDAGEKMTGKEIEGKELNDVIAETAKEYQGGGGSTIVDALPAQGAEGTTYLLRNTIEHEPLSVDFYEYICGNIETPFSDHFIVSSDYGMGKKFVDAVLEKVGYNSEEYGWMRINAELDFNNVEPSDWENFIADKNVIIVTSEDELPSEEPSESYIIFYKKIISPEMLNVFQHKYFDHEGQEVEFLVELTITNPNTMRYEISWENNKLTAKERNILYEDGALTIDPWQEDEVANVVGTLTDSLIDNQEVFDNLTHGTGYHILVSPFEPTYEYSYTEYIFDKGVYTPLGGGNLYTILVTTEGHYYGNCSFTMQVDVSTLQNGNDLMKYLKDKGFYETNDCYFPIVGTAHKTSGGSEFGRIFGLRASDGEAGDIFWGLSTLPSGFYNGEFLIGEPEYITINYYQPNQN